METINRSLTTAKNWMLNAVSERRSTLNIENTIPSRSKLVSTVNSCYSEGLQITSYMDRLIASCRNSAGVRFLAQVQNDLLTTIPHARMTRSRRGGMFSLSSDDSGICVSQSTRSSNDQSTYSSTESINKIVEQFKLKQKNDRTCYSTKNIKQCPEDQVNRSPDLSTTSFDMEERSIRKGSVMSVPIRNSTKRPSTFSLRGQLPHDSKDSSYSLKSKPYSPSCGFRKQNRRQSNLFDTKPCIKICLQYFRNANQLRAILLKTKNLTVKPRTIFVRCSLYRNNTHIKSCTQKMPSANLEKINEEIIFDNTPFRSEESWSLLVNLYTRKNIFSRKKSIGRVHLPLNDGDLFMNNDCWCLLQTEPTHNSVVASEGKDFHVVSTDESIRAKAKASLTASALEIFAINNEFSPLFTWKPSRTLRRANTEPKYVTRRR